MKLKLLIAAAALGLTYATFAADIGTTTTIKPNMATACTTNDYLSEIVKLRSEDYAAYEQLFMQRYLAKQCTYLEGGDVVTVTDRTLWYNTIQVRPKGSYIKYWVYDSAIGEG